MDGDANAEVGSECMTLRRFEALDGRKAPCWDCCDATHWTDIGGGWFLLCGATDEIVELAAVADEGCDLVDW